MLLTVSMLFLLYGVIGGLVVTFVVDDNRLFVFTLPFTLVGLLGLQLTGVISRLAERVEHLERSQDRRSREPADASNLGDSNRVGH
jgi:hypothetical protein